MNFEPSPLLTKLNRIADQPGPVEITKQLAGQLVDSDELTFSEAIDYVSLRRRLNFAEQLRRQLVEGTNIANRPDKLRP